MSDDEAVKIANLTNGFAYAYQVLGYLLYEQNGILSDDVLVTYDQYIIYAYFGHQQMPLNHYYRLYLIIVMI